MDLGAPELLIILVIGLLVFGSSRLPKLARSIGQASREFKAGLVEGSTEDKAPAEATETAITRTQTELDALHTEPEAVVHDVVGPV